MELSLFDFDFTNEREEVTFDMIETGFEKLRIMFKDRRNPHFMGIKDLPYDIRRFIDEYESEGWIVIKRGRVGIDIKSEHLLYPTIDELMN